MPGFTELYGETNEKDSRGPRLLWKLGDNSARRNLAFVVAGL
jgi:hypothetical protein